MTTALLLSAGGMFGAWQVGAWRALAGTQTIDVVVGASVGALNGWAIAGGASADELQASWTDRDTADLIRPHFPSPWLFEAEPLHRVARDLFARYHPRVPYATILAEVPRLRARLVRAEEMTWRHLAAACSIPFGFPPQRLEGHWFVDGGLLGALPLWTAAALGATRVIALDALPRMPSRVLRAGARVVQRIGAPPPPSLSDVLLLQPRQPLGTLRDAVFWKRDNVLRWIEQGERDARLSITM